MKNSKKMHIAFAPLTSENNKYIDITVNCLKDAGADVYEFYSIFKSPRLFFKTDAVILNWFERLGNTRFRRIIKCSIKKIIITLLHLTRKKIIYVFHNRINHEERGNKQSLRFMRYICTHADRLIILCSSSKIYLQEYLSPQEIKQKTFLIPHPDYIDTYIPDTVKLRQYIPAPQTDKITLLFTGAVRPYKNIELIIKMANIFKNAPFRFVIAGRPRTKEYQAELEKAAEGLNNIQFIMQFLDDDIITALIRESDALLLPYDTTSSLNSGTAILAFSNKRTVICPEIGTLQDLPAEICYSYEYRTPQEHQQKLQETLHMLLQSQDISCIKQNLKDRGEEAYNQLQKNNSKQVVTSRYRQLIEELCRM